MPGPAFMQRQREDHLTIREIFRDHPRFELVESLGEGGMGSVYRARDLHFPKVVKLDAVKEMINQARDPRRMQFGLKVIF